MLYGGSAYPQFGKDEGDPPQTGDMIIVVTDVLDSTVLWGWNPEAMLEATELMEERLRDNIVRFNGFEFASDEAAPIPETECAQTMHFNMAPGMTDRLPLARLPLLLRRRALLPRLSAGPHEQQLAHGEPDAAILTRAHGD